ncbi:armadillo-type protein [Mycena haematopus]|nr:armadillo-type protein [Mycena haematopus]
MPTLSRQESRPSIHSWWSDSNPGLWGPTINLHTAAKPLSKFLHHRQALDIMRKNRDSPLSTPMLDMYSSYFPWDFVSWSTKAAILSELAERSTSEVEARAVVDSPVFPHAAQMLWSPNPRSRRASCRLLKNLASYNFTGTAFLKLKACEQLVSLLRNEDPGVIADATSVLCGIADVVEGAQAMVDAKVLNHIWILLEAPSPLVRHSTCKLVGTLARHQCTVPAILELKLSVRIVSLLLNRNDSSLFKSAMYTLCQIARSVDGAMAMVDAKVLDHVSTSFESSNPPTRRWACELMGRLASHKSTVSAVLKMNPCVRIVSFLDDDESAIIESTLFALSQIARWIDGAKALVDAKVLNHVLALLESLNPSAQRWTCELLGWLACHELTAPSILELNPCEWIVSLLSGNDSCVIEWATCTLFQIARSVDGAKAMVDAKVLDHVLILFKSPTPSIRRWACELVGRLANHNSTRSAVLKLNPCVQIVSLLGGDDSEVIRAATFALSLIAPTADGAKAVVDAKALDYVLALLESPNPYSRIWTCLMVGRLVCYQSTMPAILELKPCVRLVSLLQHEDPEVVLGAMFALSQIAQWIDGAEAVVDAKTLDYVLELLKSPDAGIRKWTCVLVGELAGHESTAPVILRLKPCVRLVSLFRYYTVIPAATLALSVIAQVVKGARAIVRAKATDHILTLLEAARPEVLTWTCNLIGALASHRSTAPDMLKLKLCAHLVPFLHNRHSEVIESTIYALSQIARWGEGAQAVLDAKATKHILISIRSSNPVIRARTAELVGTLVSHRATGPAILQLALCLCARLVSFLYDDHSQVIQSATYALSQIARWVDGPQSIVNVKAACHVLRLLESPSSVVRTWTCELVGRLASHESTAPAILKLKPCGLIVSLLNNDDSEIIESATYALCHIASRANGALAVVNANATDHILMLLESDSSGIREWTCELVGRLASHECTVPTILELNPCAKIVSLLGDDDPTIVRAATLALSLIVPWLDGAKAVVNANVLDYVLVLLKSPNTEVRRWTAVLLGGLAIHGSTLSAILEPKQSQRLVSLLRSYGYSGNRIVHTVSNSPTPNGPCKDARPHLGIAQMAGPVHLKTDLRRGEKAFSSVVFNLKPYPPLCRSRRPASFASGTSILQCATHNLPAGSN